MQRQFIFLGMIVGSIIGGYLPALFGVSVFSVISILTGALGDLIGIYIAYKLTRDF